MKVFLYLAICGVMWVVSLFLLMVKFDMGWDGILLLATFGGGCAGTLVFSMLIGRKEKEVKGE